MGVVGQIILKRDLHASVKIFQQFHVWQSVVIRKIFPNHKRIYSSETHVFDITVLQFLDRKKANSLCADIDIKVPQPALYSFTLFVKRSVLLDIYLYYS